MTTMQFVKQKKPKVEKAPPVDPRQIATRILQAGQTPLEIMCVHLGEFHNIAMKNLERMKLIDPNDEPDLHERLKEDYRAAAFDAVHVAKEVAPFLHPKLASTEIWIDQPSPVVQRMELTTAEQLKRLIRGPAPPAIDVQEQPD